MRPEDPIPDPSDSLPAEQVEWLLAKGAVAERDVPWLAALLMRPGVLLFGDQLATDQPDPDLFEDAVQHVARTYEEHADARDTAVVAILRFVMGFGPNWIVLDESSSWAADATGERAIVEAVSDTAVEIDVAGGLVPLLAANPDDGHLWRFARRLVNLDLVDPGAVNRHLDWPTALKALELQFDNTKLANPQRMEFWIKLLRAQVIAPLVSSFGDVDDVEAGRRALAIHRAISNRYGLHISGGGPKWEQFEEPLRALYQELDRRKPERSDHALLQRAWWQTAWRCYADTPDELSLEQRQRVVESARERWGRLRPELADAHLQDSVDRFNWTRDELEIAFFVVASLGGAWEAIKLVVLALRQLTVPAVGDDLRFWREPPDLPHPPLPWCEVLNWLSMAVSSFAVRERRDDPTLLALRSAFADFCASRLRSKKQARKKKTLEADDLVEPNARWRLGYLRALQALQVNPDGKGHRTVHHASKHDPDAEVREAAAEAYPVVQSAGDGPPNIAPIRALHRATWWLRRAHAEALGLKIDEVGAQRTHAKEVRGVKKRETE